MTTIKEIPLLFQTEMVQAILADRKTQTRRTKGLDEINKKPETYQYKGVFDTGNHIFGRMWKGHFVQSEHVKCPYGKPGDLLWVRENFKIIPPNQLHFQADPENKAVKGWKPSIHMPKAAARLWLMVEEISVERMQDISEEDAVNEGVEVVKIKGSDGTFYKHYNVTGALKKIADANNADPLTIHPVSSFQSLWESINGYESWKANPWVWVVKSRILSKTGRPADEIILQHHKSITGATTADLPSSVSGLPSPITH